MEYEAFAAYLKAFKDTDGNGYANLTSAASPLAALKNYPINYENAAGSGRTVVWTRRQPSRRARDSRGACRSRQG